MATLTLTENEIYMGNLILVNAKSPLVTENKTKLIAVDKKHPEILMEQNAAKVLSNVLLDLKYADKIVPVSGYRSKEEQKQIYADSMQESGQEFTEKYVALPNHSEHQTGYAIDLGLKKGVIDFIRPNFPYYGICDKFRKMAPQYGFVERYQRGKETITGIAHEPWHFRFVGYPHSKIISEQGLSLEEYMEYIKKKGSDSKQLQVVSRKQKIEIFYVPFSASKQLTLYIPDKCRYQVSGNNMDGFIITLWRQQK